MVEKGNQAFRFRHFMLFAWEDAQFIQKLGNRVLLASAEVMEVLDLQGG